MKAKAVVPIAPVVGAEPERKRFQKVGPSWIDTYPDGTFVVTLPNGQIHKSETFAPLKKLAEDFMAASAEEAIKKCGPKKTGNFADDVRGGYYEFNPFDYDINKKEYQTFGSARGGEFDADCIAYLRSEGVPEQYCAKCYEVAWEDGHSYGYNEVLIHLCKVADIFKV